MRLDMKVESGRNATTLSSKKDEFTSIKLPTKFVEWLRKEAESQGKFMYRLVLDHVAANVRGRPWDKRK